MAAYDLSEIVCAYVGDNTIACTDCLRDDDDIKQEDIITELDEEKFYFCDRCKKRIQ